MIALLEQSEGLVAATPLRFQRYLAREIDWNSRLIGIKGARGTGKTTLLLQWLRQKGLPAHKAAYFSLDDLYFATHSLVDTGRQFYKEGGQVLVLDEVHKYPGWAREIKNLYDFHQDLQMVFTGSSIIDIAQQEGDLSRRALMYELHGLSFREYLAFTGSLAYEPLELKHLTEGSPSLRDSFPRDFRPLEHFHKYLSHGYYPFFRESERGYHRRLRQLVRTMVEYDMAELKGFDIRNAKKMLQLLSVISQQVPFKPNISALAQKSGIHRNSLNNYLHFLAEARLIGLLYPAGRSVAALQKPEKVYLDNPNLLYALGMGNAERGTAREVFFYNQLRVRHRLAQSKQADFLVNDQLIFEIGGLNKTAQQIRGLPDAWVVQDDLAFPVGRALPLWLFGFLY